MLVLGMCRVFYVIHEVSGSGIISVALIERVGGSSQKKVAINHESGVKVPWSSNLKVTQDPLLATSEER